MCQQIAFGVPSPSDFGSIFTILPWTRDPPRSIQVNASRGILDDIPPPIYHAQPKLISNKGYCVSLVRNRV